MRLLRRLAGGPFVFVALDEACSLAYDAASVLNSLGVRLERAAQRAASSAKRAVDTEGPGGDSPLADDCVVIERTLEGPSDG